METLERAFRLLPDTAIITDVYWYVLDFNRAFPFEGLRRGARLTRFMPDCAGFPEDDWALDGRVFRRAVSRVWENGACVGHVAYLADITEEERLVRQRRRRREELERMTREQAEANARLEAYARQVEALMGHEEQLRIARAIHDGAGHAITALNTLSRMCLQLKDADPAQYERRLEEGIDLCRRAAKGQSLCHYDSLTRMLEAFRDTSPFPIDLQISGEETPSVNALCDVVYKACKEAYHNALSHSLGDRLTMQVRMGEAALEIHIFDNGCFRGPFEKGFGLTAMEENVRASGGSVTFEAREGEGFGLRAEWRRSA